MSGEPNVKKQKFTNPSKRNYYLPQNKRKFLEIGQRGFLATCNYREKACIREAYNILNHYADTDDAGDDKTPLPKPEEKEDAGDIADALEDDINKTNKEIKKKTFRFQAVDTGTTNCLFIKTILSNHIELGVKIVKDIAETKLQRSRNLFRLVPIETVCRANLKDIVDSAGTIFDKYFLKEPKTFSIIFSKRYNNVVKRDDVVKELAELIASKNVRNKVDLKNPELSVIVEVIKGLCCLAVLPDYVKLKKYNLVELAAKTESGKVEDGGIKENQEKSDEDNKSDLKVDGTNENE